MDASKQNYFRTDDLSKIRDRLKVHAAISQKRGALVRDSKAKIIFDITSEMRQLLDQIDCFIPEKGDAIRYCNRCANGSSSHDEDMEAQITSLREENEKLKSELERFHACANLRGSPNFFNPEICQERKRGRPRKRSTSSSSDMVQILCSVLNLLGYGVSTYPINAEAVNTEIVRDDQVSTSPPSEKHTDTKSDKVEHRGSTHDKRDDRYYKERTTHLLEGEAVVACLDDDFQSTRNVEVQDGQYQTLSECLQNDMVACSALVHGCESDSNAEHAVRSAMSRFRSNVNSVKVWHDYGTNDKKQIVRAYSQVLTKYSMMRFDRYPGLEEWFQTLNFWFQRRFKPGGDFRYNCSSIPKWIEDICMVLGNEFGGPTWTKSRDEFKNWCLSLDKFGGKNNYAHYGVPKYIHDAISSQQVKAFRNIVLWDIMNAVGFFQELNSKLPKCCSEVIEQLSWSWPAYALRNRLDAQPDFDPDRRETGTSLYYVPGRDVNTLMGWMPWDASATWGLDTSYTVSTMPYGLFQNASKIVRKLSSRDRLIQACCV